MVETPVSDYETSFRIQTGQTVFQSAQCFKMAFTERFISDLKSA